MIKKILPYIIGLSLLAAPALATSIKYSQLTSGGTIATTDVFPVLRTTAVSNAVTAGGLIKLTVGSTTGIATGDPLSVSGVTGTTEANGQWIVTVNDATHLTLQGSVFANAYVSGGQVNFNPGVVVGALAATTPGTGVATALGINIGSAGAPVLFNGALGTPSSGTATNLTGTASALNIGGNAATATTATSATTATNATNTGITEDTTTNATMYPTWVTANTGNLPQKTTSTKLTFNPSTGMLSSTGFTGTLTGNASTVTNGVYTTDTGSVTNTMLAGSIANAKLANAATTVNGQTCTLGSTCTTTSAASTLTGTTLASGVVTSSLTSTGTLTGGATGAGFTVALGTSTLTGTLPAANNETNLRHSSIGANFSGGGSVIAANSKQWVYVPYGTTIQSWTIACDVSGSIAFDVQMDTYANFSTAMTSIAGTDFPTITSAQKAQDLVLTGWGTTAIPAGDYILFKVTSATTVTNCNIVLDTVRT